jgi:hypothetical protein
MVTAILTGLFGLLGVLVGAVLTPWMNRRADQQRDFDSAREAWLLLREDARVALEVAQDRLRKDKWPIVSHQDWSSVWRASRGILVRHVDAPRFRSIAAAFAQMDRLESAVNTPRDPNRRSLTDLDRQFLTQMSALLATALATLESDQPRISGAA